MFRDYFLNKQSEQSFRLFKLIKSFNAANFTVNKLSRIVGMGYGQTYKAFRSVLADLVTLTGMQPASDKEPEFAILAANVDVDQYQSFLLRQSVSFQFFSATLTNDGLDIDQFCNERNITMRTLKRQIDPFRKYLMERELDVDLSTGKPVGDELQLLFMMHEFFSQGYRGGPWPFDNPNAEETLSMYAVTNNSDPKRGFAAHTLPTRRAMIDIAVVAIRLRQGHIPRINPRLIAIFRGREPLPTLNITPEFFPNLNEDQTRRARLTAYFFWTNLTTLPTDNRPINREFCEYMASFANPVNSMVQRLRACIGELLDAQKRTTFLANQVVRTNMYKALMNYYIVESSFVKVSDFTTIDDNMLQYKPLMATIDHCIKSIPVDAPEHLFVRLATEVRASLFTTLAPTLYLFESSRPLNVRLELEGQSFLNQDIVGFLNSFAFINVVDQGSTVQPDVILCSIDNYAETYQLLHPNEDVQARPQIIYWGTSSEDTDLLNIIQRISNLAEEKTATLQNDNA